MTDTPQNTIIYQSDTGAISLQADNNTETIWATQKQMAQLFNIERSVITKHIKQIIESEELLEDSVCANFAHTANDGKTYNTKHYNLDMIISVGYRVNSKQATNFRKWATYVLKEHITKGYSINQEFFVNRKAKVQQAIDEIRLLASDNDLISKDNVLDLIQGFTHTWFSLQKYDTDNLPQKGSLKADIDLSSQELYAQIQTLKQSLIDKGEATPLFAQEKQQGSLDGILGNVMQNVFGEEIYPTIEEKAAHLLYFIIKNHPFNDGNKRTGAFSFIWFLQQCEFPLIECITPNVLTALTLFIAESEPQAKDRVIGLVLQMLNFK